MQTLELPQLETQKLQPANLERVTLYQRDADRDHVFSCAIEPAGERFMVNFAHGRRGSTLNVGTLTNVPVPYPNARRLFDQSVKAQLRKGYLPGA